MLIAKILRRATIRLIPQNSSLHFSSLLNPTKTLTLTQNPNPKPLSEPHLRALVLAQYSHGKFSDLLRNVVASPSVLATACHNLATSHAPIGPVSTRFSIAELGREIAENRFDFDACCAKTASFGDKGEFLILPNLKLKVFIEAIRVVLEIVYDERFVTFCYGGRARMGRHTAIRYLKNSVESPSWWFSVGFDRGKFDSHNVDRLCLFMGEKISDVELIGVIKRLFECGIVGIELGGCYLGRGFPQESGLSSILINVYFDGFDKELQEMRLRRNEESPKFELNDDVYFKPVKIYAVRYLDEILVITSGSKKLTMGLKNWAVRYLERRLGLKVDKEKTVIHSAVSEKIGFMGMVLQAVPPSVLLRPLSEKAIRARKKYLRQKEVKALELRNARERNRKNLGLKILGHLFTKFKKSENLKCEYRIENEVREIFGVWADEVVKEFLGNLDDRWAWHRKLSAGHFLTLRHIRDQLPRELVDSYDKFQEQVDKHLSPSKARKELEAQQRIEEDEEEQKYSKNTINDLTRLCMKVDAPIELVRKAVRLVGFTNEMGRPRPITLLTALEDADIIKWYAGIGRRWLDFFCCCHNFKMVKTVVSYHLRFSCILTLAEKHECTKVQAIKRYTKDLKVLDLDGKPEFQFPTGREVRMMGDRNLSDPKPVDGALTLILIRLASDEPPYSCIAHFCDRIDTTVYRLRLLQKRLKVNPSDDNNWVKGIGTIHDSLHLKCLPLCPDHIHDLYMGRITLQDIDCTSFVDVD